MSNRIVAGLCILLVVAVIQVNMSATRRILEGAARYGELRATTDELTGVYNRRPVVAQLTQWAERGRGNYAIALIDLDHFKTINDEFGHDCGDTVLQEVALTLRSHFRETDMVSRWGGDEFLVLMPGVRHADVVPVLERLRRAIKLIEKRCPEHVHHASVSIGAAMGAMGQSPDECIAAADHALYRAKEEGRDKVVAVGVMEATHAQGRPSPDVSVGTPPEYVNRG
ncbi:MAG TPA: GGDEF domain-containing protein [Demequina sp.]|nr:GGDEF domain-containing protein [Demequina sp.]